MSDLNEYQIGDVPRTLELRVPGSGRKIMEIDLLSSDSEKVSELRASQESRRLKNAIRMQRVDRSEIESDALELLVAATVAWRGEDGTEASVTWKGQSFPCTKANVRTLYDEVKWIRREVDRFVNDVASFLESSPTDGANG